MKLSGGIVIIPPPNSQKLLISYVFTYSFTVKVNVTFDARKSELDT